MLGDITVDVDIQGESPKPPQLLVAKPFDF